MTPKETSLPRLSDEQLSEARSQLEIWSTPQEFFNKVDVLSAKVSSEDLFNAPRFGFLRDAMILADYAVKMDGAKSVRLATQYERFPDGFVTVSKKTLKIEVTEADRETRRRGDEYKSGAAPQDPGPNQPAQEMTISAELERVIQKKANKRYNPKPTLVVYLNLDEPGIDQGKVLSILDEAKRRHASSFENIYLLWKGELLQ